MKFGFLKFEAAAVVLTFVAMNARACEQCKCQGANPIDLLSAASLEGAYRDGAKPRPQTESQEKSAGEAAPKSDVGITSTPLVKQSSETGTPAVAPITSEVATTRRQHSWYFDTLFEFISYKHASVARANRILDLGRDTHAHIKEFDITQRFAYDVSDDLQVSLAQGFRSLYLKEIEDPDILGEHERSQGPTDLDVGVQYRFMHQRACGFPVDLLVFADVKAPTGTTNNRRPNGELFETEDQPGTGSVNETLGLSAGKRWGEWGATAAYGYTHKGEGSQRFKEGDVNRLTVTASHRISPADWRLKIYFSQGVQGFIENMARDHGQLDKDHGGQFIYAAPAITVQPNNHLVLTATGAVPIYQQENGFHQKDRFAIQFNIGVRF
jgi:hypothetical protein